MPADGNAGDGQFLRPAEVGLHQQAHGEAAGPFWQHAAGGADAAFPTVAGGAGAGTHHAFWRRPGGGVRHRGPHLRLAHGAGLQIAEEAVARLPYHGIHARVPLASRFRKSYADVRILFDGQGDQGVGHARHRLQSYRRTAQGPPA